MNISVIYWPEHVLVKFLPLVNASTSMFRVRVRISVWISIRVRVKDRIRFRFIFRVRVSDSVYGVWCKN